MSPATTYFEQMNCGTHISLTKSLYAFQLPNYSTLLEAGSRYQLLGREHDLIRNSYTRIRNMRYYGDILRIAINPSCKWLNSDYLLCISTLVAQQCLCPVPLQLYISS